MDFGSTDYMYFTPCPLDTQVALHNNRAFGIIFPRLPVGQWFLFRRQYIAPPGRPTGIEACSRSP